jgi:hypothetical protein
LIDQSNGAHQWIEDRWDFAIEVRQKKFRRMLFAFIEVDQMHFAG